MSFKINSLYLTDGYKINLYLSDKCCTFVLNIILNEKVYKMWSGKRP